MVDANAQVNNFQNSIFIFISNTWNIFAKWKLISDGDRFTPVLQFDPADHPDNDEKKSHMKRKRRCRVKVQFLTGNKICICKW